MVCTVIRVLRQMRGRLFLFPIIFFGFNECMQTRVFAGCVKGAPGIISIAKLFCDKFGSRRSIYEQKRFVSLGCMLQLKPLLDISDTFVFLICVANILGMYVLGPILKRELDDYTACLKVDKINKFKIL